MTGSSQKIKYSVNSELISVSGRVYGELRRQQTNLAFKNVITCLRVPLYLLRVEQGCLELIFNILCDPKTPKKHFQLIS